MQNSTLSPIPAKPLAIFDQEPDGLVRTVGEAGGGMAIATLDGAVEGCRFMPSQACSVEIHDVHVGQIRHMGDLVAKSAPNRPFTF